MNIIRLYNQNRKQLFIVIIIIAFIILAIHFVNHLVKEDNKENLNSGISSSSTSSATTTYNPQQSSISSSSVSNKVYKVQSELIDKFIKYCNEGKSEEAYNLLSSDCKTVMFPTLEYFINNYQKVVFSGSKLYSIKNWTSNIYKISITENILSTGKSNNGIAIEDYFAIVNEENESKLNINGFIERYAPRRKSSNDNIEVEIIYKDIYMDYEIYTLRALNKTDKTVLLDSGESTQKMYLIDKSNVKLMSYRNEVTNAELKILPYAQNEIKIKYASTYISTRVVDFLVFEDILLDFDDYNNTSIKKEYKNRTSFKVEL